MAFVLHKERKVWWPVIIRVPVDDGNVEEHKIRLLFHIESRKKWAETDLVSDILNRVVIDWDLVNDVNGDAVAFSKKNFALLCEDERAEMAIWKTYDEQVIAGAPAKN